MILLLLLLLLQYKAAAVSVCRLQYKYMKLVASASGSNKLPAAETCALDEGEEDDDDDDDDDDDGGGSGRRSDAVRVRKGARFFHKFKMSRANDDIKVCVVDEILFIMTSRATYTLSL